MIGFSCSNELLRVVKYYNIITFEVSESYAQDHPA